MLRNIFSLYKRGSIKILSRKNTNEVLELKMIVLILTDANIIYKTSTLAYTLIISAE